MQIGSRADAESSSLQSRNTVRVSLSLSPPIVEGRFSSSRISLTLSLSSFRCTGYWYGKLKSAELLLCGGCDLAAGSTSLLAQHVEHATPLVDFLVITLSFAVTCNTHRGEGAFILQTFMICISACNGLGVLCVCTLKALVHYQTLSYDTDTSLTYSRQS